MPTEVPRAWQFGRRGDFGIRTPREAYEYAEGRVDVRFRHAKYDWIQMRIRAYGRSRRTTYLDEEMRAVGSEWFSGRHSEISCRLSSVYCPFRCLLRWLEAVTTGVQTCGFDWEGEGPGGFMGWQNNGLKVRWPVDGETERVLEVFAERKQVVGAFYQAFRRFVESSEYYPERYEKLRAGEEIEIAMNREYTEEEIRGQLIDMDAEEAEKTLQELRPMGWTTVEGMEPFEPGAFAATVRAVFAERDGREPERNLRTIAFPYIKGPWDRWSKSRRREYLNKVFDEIGHQAWGAPLRKLRSELVERWLGWPSTTVPAAR